MKFIRLTSVFLCCALLSSFLILPASAADDDNYYSAPVVFDGSPSVAPTSLGGIMLAATGWDSNDKAILESIYKVIQCLLVKPSSVMAGSLFSQILDISSNTASILNNLGGVDGIATENTLSALSQKFTDSLVNPWLYLDGNTSFQSYNPSIGRIFDFSVPDPAGGKNYSVFWRLKDVIGALNQCFLVDRKFSFSTPNGTVPTWTIYHYIKRLSEVLANDDDLALREDQKENVNQVKQDFITGTSGKTSLGKDDFGSLSSVGGTFKDITSLNGQSSITDFTSGLTDADTAGQGWFSQSTKDALDSVTDSTSSISTVSTFSDDGLSSVDVDPDPYNMGNFEDNYSWLWGED